MNLTLAGKTAKGRNLVKRFGAEWTVLKHEQSVLCIDGCEGFFIAPFMPLELLAVATRWVARFNDDDFNIQEHD